MYFLVKPTMRTIPHLLESSPAVSNLLIGVFAGTVALLGIPALSLFPMAV